MRIFLIFLFALALSANSMAQKTFGIHSAGPDLQLKSFPEPNKDKFVSGKDGLSYVYLKNDSGSATYKLIDPRPEINNQTLSLSWDFKNKTCSINQIAGLKTECQFSGNTAILFDVCSHLGEYRCFQ